jgi:hypothetical protein
VSKDGASSSPEGQVKKEELQERVQAKAEDIGGGGLEGSLVTKTEEVSITEARKQQRKTRNESLKSSDATMKKEPINDLATISKQLEKQGN